MWCWSKAHGWLRIALLGTAGAVALSGFILFGYELARARVPQHRAALERLVRAQTGLDVRFTELGLRWGWYGPEAVFRHVELDEPGNSQALLRAPELIVGFDAWRTLRNGHPEAGRIELIAPDIDLSSGAAHRRIASTEVAGAADPVTGVGPPVESASLGRIAALQRWRGGRIDIAGGTVRLPSGTANPLSVQMRSATLHRSDDEWNVAGTLFLPDGVGRSARVTLRVRGDLGQVSALSGTARVDARRILFPGCRDFLAGILGVVDVMPRAGSGDMTASVSFERGRIVKAQGTVQAQGLVFDSPAGAALALARLNGNWKATRLAAGWRFRADSIDLARGQRLASLTLDSGAAAAPEPARVASPGRWIRGSLEQAPLQSVLAMTRWLAPHLDLAGIGLDGTVRRLTFDWASGRAEGQKLLAAAALENVALTPRSRDFVLGGLDANVSGTEGDLTIAVHSRTARLELTQSQQEPLADVHVFSTLHVSSGRDGWQLETDEFLLEHRRASLRLSGSLQNNSMEPRILASGSLTGADIPLVLRLLGAHAAETFGAAASRLTAGQIQNAEFALRGPIGKLPFAGGHGAFTGSLTLRNAVISGGDLWPDADGIDAHVEWQGAQIQAMVEAGRAGPFQLASANAQWGADGRSATRLKGHVTGRLEDALAWVRDHPHLQDYAPEIGNVDARGDASFDFNVSVAPDVSSEASARSGVLVDTGPGVSVGTWGDAHGVPRASSDASVRSGSKVMQHEVVGRVSTFLDGATVQSVAGLPPLQGVTGSFVFDAGHLQRSTLTGSWLGGPVTLHLGEHREKSTRVLAVQAQGTLDAGQLARLVNAPATVDGAAAWSGELAYLRSDSRQSPRWRMRADSNLLGIVSALPEPFGKRSAAVVPVHLEVAGTDDSAQLRVRLSDRMRSLLSLRRQPGGEWFVERGTVRLGTAVVPSLPVAPVLVVAGRVSRLDLLAYAVAWQRLRQDSLPTIRAQVVAAEMWLGDRRYDEISLRAERTAAGTNLLLDSPAVAGSVQWPALRALARGRGIANEAQRAEVHLTRLELPAGTLPADGVGFIAALAPTASLTVDDLSLNGRSLGRLTATVTAAHDEALAMDDLRLVNVAHDARGELHCQASLSVCRLTFMLDSTDAAATLAEFGFTPDLAAATASLTGDVEWNPAAERPWLASLRGTVSMRLADGMLADVRRSVATSVAALHDGAAGYDSLAAAKGSSASDSPGSANGSATDGPGEGAADRGRVGATFPFPLLAVPALVYGLDASGAPGASLTKEQHPLQFARLQADFELQDGQALTSNLHFDGDAEILMRGRIGLVSRDYDQQVWLLRGEERLPAAVRRFGVTPRVAAAWLSLRDIFGGSGSQDRSLAALRLQGSWDDPMVVTLN